MNKLHIHACPLCGNNQLKPVMNCMDYYASGETFELYQCQACGFLFTQDAPVEAEIGRYYETPDYIAHTDTHKGIVNSIYHLVRKHMLRTKAQLITQALGKSTGKLLDIGTGTGYFPHYMQQKGWQVQAIEKSAQARAFAKQHFAIDIYDENQLDKLEPESFEVVTLWHVMEHLEHLNKTWERLHELVTDDGILVVAVPNCSSYDAQRYQHFWAAYDVPRHLWHFTPSTLQQFAVKHHFMLSASKPMPFDAFYVSMLSEKYKKARFPFAKGMYAGIKAWFHTLQHPEESSSMIYILRKKKP